MSPQLPSGLQQASLFFSASLFVCLFVCLLVFVVVVAVGLEAIVLLQNNKANVLTVHTFRLPVVLESGCASKSRVARCGNPACPWWCSVGVQLVFCWCAVGAMQVGLIQCQKQI
jgi:hypothetical protein